MLIAAVVISSFILLSSAQYSPNCTAAYYDVFGTNATETCAEAYYAVFYGNATYNQTAMVCSADRQCNMMLEYIIYACRNDTIEYPTRLSQDLLCISDSNGSSCLYAFTQLINNESNIFEEISQYCSFSCNQYCYEILTTNYTSGCCFGEIIYALYEQGEISSTQATLYSDAYPGVCGLGDFVLCNGTILPPSNCSNAIVYLFSPNDTCSRAVQYLLKGNTEGLPYIFDATCAPRFHYFVTDCSVVLDEDDDDDDDGLQDLADIAFAISQRTNANGTSCSELASMLLGGDEIPCNTDYLLRQCSYGCKEILRNVTAEYGCCFNTIVTEFNSRSDEVSDQIETVILTREIYDLCEIYPGGFCDGTTPPSYTLYAERCVSAGDTFFADDTCIDYYRTLGYQYSSMAAELNDAATAICTNNTCMSRMDSYINYLLTCRVGSVQDDDYDDDDDDDDDDDEDTKYLDLAYLTGNTTCRERSNDYSCYSSIFSNPVYATVSAAFDEYGVCASLEPTCSDECRQLLTSTMNMDSVGCCLGEYGRALLGDNAIERISESCEISQLTNRCGQIQAGVRPGNSDGGGASTQKGFGVLIVLLGMTTIAFY